MYEKALKQKAELKPTKVGLKTYTNEKIPLSVKCYVKVKCNGREKLLPLFIIKGLSPSLLGRNWLNQLSLNWSEIIINKVQVSFSLERKLQKILAQSDVIN